MKITKTNYAITEKQVKERIKKILKIFEKYVPIYTFCPMTFGYGESGHPDRVVLIGGAFLGIEVKKDSNNHHCRPELKPKPNEVMQKKQALRIKNAGGQWLCIHKDNLDTLIGELDYYADMKLFTKEDKKTLKELCLWQ